MVHFSDSISSAVAAQRTSDLPRQDADVVAVRVLMVAHRAAGVSLHRQHPADVELRVLLHDYTFAHDYGVLAQRLEVEMLGLQVLLQSLVDGFGHAAFLFSVVLQRRRTFAHTHE